MSAEFNGHEPANGQSIDVQQLAPMELIAPRTYASALDNAELILFDFLWDKDSPKKFLYADIFCLHANTPYSHSIPDDQLHSWLLELVNRNLLCLHKPEPVLPWQNIQPEHDIAGAWGSEDRFGLTKQGFEAWESERLPDWSRYVGDSHGFDDLVVTAVSKQIGLKFIEACRKCGLLDIVAEEPSYRLEKNVALCPWKTFSEMHYFTIRTAFDMSKPVNWPLYEADRVWWRCTSELWVPGKPSPCYTA